MLLFESAKLGKRFAGFQKKREKEGIKENSLIYIQYIFWKGDGGDKEKKANEYSIFFWPGGWETPEKRKDKNGQAQHSRFEQQAQVLVMAV